MVVAAEPDVASDDTPPPSPPPRRRRWFLATTIAIAVIAAASAVGFAVTRHRGGRPDRPSAAPAATLPSAPAPIDPRVAERAFVIALNLRRTHLHLRPLSVDPALTQVARNWSNAMATTKGLSHNPDIAAEVPPGIWQRLGENVGVGATVAAIHDAFLHSPHHYENVVDPKWDRVGVGVLVRNRVIWVTVNFEELKLPH